MEIYKCLTEVEIDMSQRNNNNVGDRINGVIKKITIVNDLVLYTILYYKDKEPKEVELSEFYFTVANAKEEKLTLGYK